MENNKLARLDGLEHLYLWMREHNFPAPCDVLDLGPYKYDVIRWVALSLYRPRRIGDFQLCLVGPTESQKTLIVQMLSS
jgi:hypothetical protein